MSELSPEQQLAEELSGNMRSDPTAQQIGGQGPQNPQINSTIQQLNQQTIDPSKNAINPAQGVCPECNMVHPPLPNGQKCPNKPVDPSESGGITQEQINKYLVNLKNIIFSQIQQRGIKDGNKLFQQLTINITKYLESYTEK